MRFITIVLCFAAQSAFAQTAVKNGTGSSFIRNSRTATIAVSGKGIVGMMEKEEKKMVAQPGAATGFVKSSWRLRQLNLAAAMSEAGDTEINLAPAVQREAVRSNIKSSWRLKQLNAEAAAANGGLQTTNNLESAASVQQEAISSNVKSSSWRLNQLNAEAAAANEAVQPENSTWVARGAIQSNITRGFVKNSWRLKQLNLAAAMNEAGQEENSNTPVPAVGSVAAAGFVKSGWQSKQLNLSAAINAAAQEKANAASTVNAVQPAATVTQAAATNTWNTSTPAAPANTWNANTPAAATGTAFDILRKDPAVIVTGNDESISVNGRAGVAVFINGRRTAMTGEALVRLLKSIPAESVQKVEVITNPAAAQDVQANTAVISITTNRKVITGINGSLNFYNARGINNRGSYSGALNIGAGNVSVYANFVHDYGKYLVNSIEDRYINNGNTLLSINSKYLDKWNDPKLRVGADWYINKKHTLGIIAEMDRTASGQDHETMITVGRPGMSPDSVTYTTGTTPSVRKWKTINLNYTYTDTLGNELAIDIDRGSFNKTLDRTVNNFLLPAAAPAKGSVNNLYTTNTNIDNFTVRTAFTRTFRSKLKLETGIRLSFVDNNAGQSARSVSGGISTAAPAYSGDYDYSENIFAAYANLTKRIKKWTLQGGLRYEQTTAAAVSGYPGGSIAGSFNKNYSNLLPSASANYRSNNNNSFRFSLSQKLVRPAYEDFQPFGWQVDPFLYTVGNPQLDIQKVMAYEVSWNYKYKLDVKAGYFFTRDFYALTPYQQNGINYDIIENTGTSSRYSVDVSYPVSAAKWWTSENKLTLFYTSFEGSTTEGYVNEGIASYTFYTTQRFVLPWSNILRVTFRYNSPTLKVFNRSSDNSNLGLSIGRMILNKKGMLRLGVSDLLKGQRRIVTTNFGKLNLVQNNTWDSRIFTAEFSVNFGSKKIRDVRQHGIGNTNEKDRSKN